MSILFTLFTIWIYGMLIFWGGLFALRALGGIMDAFRTEKVYVRVEPTVKVYAKEEERKSWLELERERGDRRYGDGYGEVELSELEQIMEDNDDGEY